MIENNPMYVLCSYATCSSYCSAPDMDQIRRGVIPLDSLPAAWWNWMWGQVNSDVNCAGRALTSVIGEIKCVLDAAGYEPQEACFNQLYLSINKIRQTVGNASVAGSVKSCEAKGYVSIDENGYMTANGLGNVAQLTTNVKTSVVAAINELKTTYDNCIGSLDSLVSGKLGKNECAYDSARLGNTTKAELLSCVSCTEGTLNITVGGTTCSVDIGNTPLSNNVGCALGEASAGVSTTASRSDHVHPMPIKVCCAEETETALGQGVCYCEELAHKYLYSNPRTLWGLATVPWSSGDASPHCPYCYAVCYASANAYICTLTGCAYGFSSMRTGQTAAYGIPYYPMPDTSPEAGLIVNDDGSIGKRPTKYEGFILYDMCCAGYSNSTYNNCTGDRGNPPRMPVYGGCLMQASMLRFSTFELTNPELASGYVPGISTCVSKTFCPYYIFNPRYICCIDTTLNRICFSGTSAQEAICRIFPFCTSWKSTNTYLFEDVHTSQYTIPIDWKGTQPVVQSNE